MRLRRNHEPARRWVRAGPGTIGLATRRAALAAVAIATLGAGCTTAPDDAASTSGESTSLSVAETELGPIIVDRDGFALYLFVADQRGASTCAGTCAESWPPVPSDGVTASDPLDPSLLGRVERADGTEQLTYNGWPLYRFAGDAGPGAVNGHGQVNAWFALNPLGGPAGETE